MDRSKIELNGVKTHIVLSKTHIEDFDYDRGLVVGVVGVVAGVSAQLLGLPGIPHVSLSSASPVRRYRPNKGRILEHLSIRIPVSFLLD